MSGFIPNVPKPVSWLLKAAIACICVYFVIHKVPLNSVLPTLESCNFSFVILSILLQFVLVFANAIRWKILLRHPELALHKFLYFVFLGQFFNLFLPTYVASEAIKVYAFGKKYGGTQENVGISLITKFTGIIVQIVMGGVGLIIYAKKLSEQGLFNHLNINLIAIISGISFIGFSIFIFIWFRRSIKVQVWYLTIVEISKNRNLFLNNLILTIVIQFLGAGSNYFLFSSLWPDTHFWEVVLFTTIILGMLSLPFGFGGVGIREYLTLLLFTDIGKIPSQITFAANVIGYIPIFIIAFTGGAWISFRKLKEKLS